MSDVDITTLTRPAGGNRLSDEEEAIRLKAYHESATDFIAAFELNISEGTFQRWRKSRGLAAKNVPRGHVKLTDDEQDRRLGVYARHRFDEPAAKELGITLPAFRMWRYRNDLPMPPVDQA